MCRGFAEYKAQRNTKNFQDSADQRSFRENWEAWSNAKSSTYLIARIGPSQVLQTENGHLACTKAVGFDSCLVCRRAGKLRGVGMPQPILAEQSEASLRLGKGALRRFIKDQSNTYFNS